MGPFGRRMGEKKSVDLEKFGICRTQSATLLSVKNSPVKISSVVLRYSMVAPYPLL